MEEGKSYEKEGELSGGKQVLLAFDQECEQLRHRVIKKSALETDHSLQFSIKLLQLQKRQKLTTEGLFKLYEMQAGNQYDYIKMSKTIR